MKSYLFIMTHLGSGGTLLSRIINSTNKITAVTNTNIVYNNIQSLNNLNSFIKYKELNQLSPIYSDKIVYNYSFYCNTFYNFAKYIFLIREPIDTIKHIISTHKYSFEGAYMYYKFRLKRLCEIAKYTDSILVEYQDVITRKAFPLIEEYLNIKYPISSYYDIFPEDNMDDDLSKGIILQNTKSPNIDIPIIRNDKYLYYLKTLRKRCKSLR